MALHRSLKELNKSEKKSDNIEKVKCGESLLYSETKKSLGLRTQISMQYVTLAHQKHDCQHSSEKKSRKGR